MKAKRTKEVPRRAALYLRISKKPQGTRSAEAHDGDTSYSVDDQRVRCEALCAASGYEVGPVFYDDGVSAFRSLKDRPGYGELRDAIGSGAFDVLVFDRQDRLARDQIETMEFIVRCARAGTAWHSAQEGAIDLTDTMAVMFAIFRGGEAQAYSEKISKNQKAANQAKRAKGLPGAGGRPFGYEADKVSIREDEAALIRRGTEMVLAGAARYQVLQVFRDSGIKTVRGSEWHVANVAALLKRWRNAGWVEHADEPVTEAVWPAIVSIDDVRSVRTILTQGRIPGRWKRPTMLCSGIAACRCGQPLMVTGADDGPAYRCSEIVTKGHYSPGNHVTIRAALLDPIVRDAALDAYFTSPATVTAGRAEAEALAKLYQRKADLQTERTRVQAGYRAGIFTEAEASREVAKIDHELAAVESDITSAAARSAHAAMLQASSAAFWFDAADAIDLPAFTEPDRKGNRKFRAGTSLVRSMVREGRTRDEAINRAVQMFWAENKDKPAVRERLGSTFDALDLEQQRNLVRSLLRITVKPGRGTDRIEVCAC